MSRLDRVALLFYVPMMVLGGLFLAPPGTLRVPDWERFALGMGAAALGGVAVILVSRKVSRHTGWGRAMQEEFTRVLAGLTSGHILRLSLLSAFGEELLFRGALHPHLGLWLTAALFALFHFPYRRTMLPWTAFALVLGLALGALTTWSASLWPAILLHFLVNYFNLHDIAAGPTPAEEGADDGAV